MKQTLLIFTLLLFFAVDVSSQSISASINDPVEAGSDLTLNITYSNSNSNDIIYAAVELKDSNGDWVATVVESTLNPVGSSGTDVATSIVLSIPAGATPTASLSGGQYYDVKIELNMENWGGWLAGTYPTLTIAASGTLSLKELDKLPAIVFPNPATDILTVQAENNNEFTSYKIFDISGRLLSKKTNNNSLQYVDVSKLSTGIYFLQLDNYQPVKFVKR